jgi:shikimate dehydrogenase
MLIINCTPLGMAPYQDQKPNIPYQLLSAKHLLYDCIYNPEKTLFLQEGEKQGCQIKNGLEMLHQQADEAWRIWERDNEAVEE